MTAIDRLITNVNSVIYFLKAFSDPTPQDVTFTWINDDGTTTDITYKNIKKFQDELSAPLANDILEELKTVDGAGSELDADLLDGHDSDYFAKANGDNTNAFKVANAINDDEAINKGQFDTAIEDINNTLEQNTGGVLQVVSLLSATQSSQTLTTSDTQVGELVKTIIPKGNNSKFLVTVRWFGEMTSPHDVCFNIHMDGNRVNINGQGRGYGLQVPSISYHNNNSSTPENVNFSTLVSTSSVIGNEIEFKVVADAGSNRTLWNNRCFGTSSSSYERGTSELIITEIGE